MPLVVLLSVDSCMLQYQSARQDVPTGTIMAKQLWGKTYSILWRPVYRRDFVLSTVSLFKNPCLGHS